MSCLLESGSWLASEHAVDQLDRRCADLACACGPVSGKKRRLRRSCSLQKVLLPPVTHNLPAAHIHRERSCVAASSSRRGGRRLPWFRLGHQGPHQPPASTFLPLAGQSKRGPEASTRSCPVWCPHQESFFWSGDLDVRCRQGCSY